MLAKAGADSSMRVLIVDDEPEIVNVLSEFLVATKRGYAVTTASNAVDALEAVRHERPQLVLLDVIMPAMSGVDALREIRRLDPSIRVIMVTGCHPADAADALKSGAFAYIPKPFELKYIDQLVAAALGR